MYEEQSSKFVLSLSLCVLLALECRGQRCFQTDVYLSKAFFALRLPLSLPLSPPSLSTCFSLFLSHLFLKLSFLWLFKLLLAQIQPFLPPIHSSLVCYTNLRQLSLKVRKKKVLVSLNVKKRES